ncbi:MAG: diaminopimelate epimerase [Candidatus Omnitrophica bacterium]|nr:diaminopimelate epimerase [Candidatus Omnitrophota bacterium]
MVAAGNDFVVLDNRARSWKGRPDAWSKKLCDRKSGIGADGVLWLERSKRSDARMRIFNPDGSEAEMCGNGVRCLAHFAVRKGLSGRGSRVTIETPAGEIKAEVRGNVVRAKLPDPKGLRLNLRVSVEGHPRNLSFIDTGVPHAVLVVGAVGRCDVETLGRQIRTHRFFKPRGTNVDFVSLGQGREIEVRTYERGVEGETLSCGTGSTASALVAAALKDLRSPVRVHTASGETLKVYFTKTDAGFREVYLEGPVKTCFEGRIAF